MNPEYEFLSLLDREDGRARMAIRGCHASNNAPTSRALSSLWMVDKNIPCHDVLAQGRRRAWETGIDLGRLKYALIRWLSCTLCVMHSIVPPHNAAASAQPCDCSPTTLNKMLPLPLRLKGLLLVVTIFFPILQACLGRFPIDCYF